MLILIGVVGIQLTLESTQTIAKLLPLWGPDRLIQRSIDPTISAGAAVPVVIVYAIGLLGAAAYVMRRRAPVRGSAEA